jgi:hypothetical protein
MMLASFVCLIAFVFACDSKKAVASFHFSFKIQTAKGIVTLKYETKPFDYAPCLKPAILHVFSNQ